MAHFVAFCIGFQKNIPLQNPPGGGGGEGVYGSSRSIGTTPYPDPWSYYLEKIILAFRLIKGYQHAKFDRDRLRNDGETVGENLL